MTEGSADRSPGEGRLTVRLHIVDGRVAPDILSERPIHACRLLEGRPAQAAVDLLPRLFALCGTAQAHAGLTAMEGALGLEPPAPHLAARRLLLMAETAREHAWRLLLDWPALIGEPPAEAALKPVLATAGRLPRRLYRFARWTDLGGGELTPDGDGLAATVAALGEAVAQAVGATPGALADADALRAWCRAGETAPARVLRAAADRGWAGLGADGPPGLPWLPEPDLDRALASDGEGALARAPDWQGQVFETGPLVRQAGHPAIAGLIADEGRGLLARLAARLIELVTLPPRMTALLPGIAAAGAATAGRGPGSGLTQLEMARGRLVHRVELADGLVARYQVVAPTEWNFHPAGPLAEALRGLPPADADTLADQARWLATALDPCVAFSVAADIGR